MKNKKSAILIIFLLNFSSIFGQNVTISGFIKDSETGESLIGAVVYCTSTKTEVVTNNYGFYSLTVPKEDSSGLIISYLNFKPQLKQIFLKENIELNIELVDLSKKLEEVVVTAKQSDKNVQRAQMGVIEIPIQKIKDLPAIFGETDVLKVIQLLPGVQSGNGGTTGFFVRGGNTDQNLVQLD